MVRPYNAPRDAELMFGSESRETISAAEDLRQISPGWYITDRKPRDFLYLLAPHDRLSCGDMVKIGRAASPLKRFRTLQCGSPVRLVYYAIFQAENAGPLETFLHEKFASIRAHGEWFSADPHDVSRFIESMTWPGLVRIYPAANDNHKG